jgi:4'-phosphopantetheinyl transferase
MPYSALPVFGSSEHWCRAGYDENAFRALAKDAISMQTVAEVHVWGIELDTNPDPFLSSLSAEELDRARRFHFPAHRDRFVVGRGILRRILSQFLNNRAADIAFEYGAFGKPRLRDRAAPHFNVSHSDHRAMIAISEDHPVGIDIERVRPLEEFARLAVLVFNERERQQMARLGDDEQMRAFFRGWSRKEAYFKATGAGLSARLHGVTVDLAESSSRVLEISGGDAGRWSMQDVPTPGGFAGALALPCPGATMVWHEDVTTRAS